MIEKAKAFMNIRDYNKKDSKEIAILLKEFLDYTRKTYDKNILIYNDFITSKKELYSKKLLSNFVTTKDSKFLILEIDSRIVGYIIGFIKTDKFKKLKSIGHIQSFFVSQKYREKNLGKNLYNKLIKWFKKKKCDCLELDVFEGNNKTISMYRKWGFKENSVQMKKKL